MTEHLPECPCVYHPSEDLWCICWRLLCCEKRITAAAVQRIEAPLSETWLAHAERAAIIAAIKGDQP